MHSTHLKWAQSPLLPGIQSSAYMYILFEVTKKKASKCICSWDQLIHKEKKFPRITLLLGEKNWLPNFEIYFAIKLNCGNLADWFATVVKQPVHFWPKILK